MSRRGALAALALVAGEALGHAALIDVEPADGAVLERAPPAAVLRFSEPVTPIAVRLLDRTGTRRDLRAVVEGESVRVALPPGLPDGPYLLSFRVTSVDSHPVAGTVAFTIGDAAGSRVPAEVLANGAVAAANVAVRIAHDLAMLLAAGGALFALLVAPFPRQRVILASAGAVAGAGALAMAGLHGVALLDSRLIDWESWRAGIGTTRGAAASAAGAGAAAIVAGALRSPGGRGWLAVGASLGIASFALSGHSAAAAPRAVAAMLVLTHVAGGAFWAGSLIGLFAILRGRSAPTAAHALSRFSDLGALAVLALIAAGIGFAAMQIDSLAELGSSAYGRWVVAKSTLLAGLLALAAWNRLRLLAALKRGDPGAAGRFRRTIMAEIVLLAATIAFAAVLAQTPPPRSAPGVQIAELERDGYSARLRVAPARTGMNTIAVSFGGRDGRRFDPAEPAVAISNPAAGVEPISRPLQRIATGEYRLEGLEIAVAGRWAIEIGARIGDFDRLSFRTEVAIR